MIALYFVLLSFAVGKRLCDSLLAGAIARARQGREERLPAWMIVWPSSYLIGTLVLTWAAYLVALMAKSQERPLFVGDAVVIALASVCVLPGWIRALRTVRLDFPRRVQAFKSALRSHWMEVALLTIVTAGGFSMIRATLALTDAKVLNIGLSVFSDFGPHLAMIRSFSFGSNFPTQYPHFPDGSIRYHFFFQFLAGNMEYMGLPIDWAFNLPSILSLAGCVSLLHSFAVVVTGRRGVGVLTVIFFLFRSSLAWLDFVRAAKPWYTFPAKIWANEGFVGKTEHEDWGLFNQNVYLNQRHLPFGLAVLLLALIVFHPRLRSLLSPSENYRVNLLSLSWWREFLFSKRAWLPESLESIYAALGMGLVLGLCSFWNGAAVIAAMVVMFFMAIFSRHRLEFLIAAVFSGFLGFLANRLLLGTSELALEPRYNFGFLSENPKSWAGVWRYYRELLGILPYVLALGFIGLQARFSTLRIYWDQRGKPAGSFLLLLIFLTPVALATTVQLTPEISINHKYIMIGVMLLNIIAASHLVSMWDSKRWIPRALAAALFVALTGTGVIDLITLVNRNQEKKVIVAKMEDPLLVWAKNNTPKSSIFLTDWYSIHPVLLSGRKIFYGWPYYAWSAGYDTLGREAIVKKIYGGTNAEEVRRLALANHIDYIVIDNENRKQPLYKIQETLLRNRFKQVFSVNDLIVLKVE